jgi:hypothetical protein
VSERETYLGDGLYASFDGYMITLRAPREHGDHWVGLEPNVFAELVEYQKRVTTPPESSSGETGEDVANGKYLVAPWLHVDRSIHYEAFFIPTGAVSMADVRDINYRVLQHCRREGNRSSGITTPATWPIAR